ncbi:MAG: hypothetical protein ACHQF4_09440 [Sphingobacteriales bacterium]
MKLLFKRKGYTITGLMIILALSVSSFFKPNEAEISNGLIKARLYLPNAVDGYYRGSRFDWSGIIASLDYSGHSYYGQWFKVYNPFINDAIMGPVEAFDPVGYDEAKAGESFVKIGVGIVTRQDDSPYNFATSYPIVNNGKWKVQVKSDRVLFKQLLKGADYAYEYNKTVRLIKDKPVMILSHTLRNTGTKIIETSVFDHNFLVMDKQPTGPGFVLTLPSHPVEKLNARMQEFVKLQDNQLIFLKDLNGRFVSFKDLTNGDGAIYSLKIENHHTGAGIKITGDKPISKLVFWSSSTTVCPEPYIKIKIAPGETFTWDITYEYYNCDITKT